MERGRILTLLDIPQRLLFFCYAGNKLQFAGKKQLINEFWNRIPKCISQKKRLEQEAFYTGSGAEVSGA
jgi:hypothetical protein